MALSSPFVNIPEYGTGGYKIVVVAGILIIMQNIMVVGRFTSRRLNKAGCAADDYVLALATGMSTILCAIAIACESNSAVTFLCSERL